MRPADKATGNCERIICSRQQGIRGDRHDAMEQIIFHLPPE
jgi:hypothetical protein